MIDVRELCYVPVETVRPIVQMIKERVGMSYESVTFDNLPTQMLFPPGGSFRGSAHLMFFPPNARQRFHFHPGVRYLLLFGDSPITIHYSRDAPPSDPSINSDRIMVPPGQLTMVRFPGG